MLLFWEEAEIRRVESAGDAAEALLVGGGSPRSATSGGDALAALAARDPGIEMA